MSKRALFLRVLSAEFEDLVEDLDLMEERYRKRFDSLNLSQYVYLENRALLEREKNFIERLIREIGLIDPSAYCDVAQIIQAIDGELAGLVQASECPEVVTALVRRKIDKVRRYTEECSPEL